jgi:malate dehydrogenase
VNISIIGAAGEVGRSLATHLLRGGLMTTTDELQLVGHGAGGVERTVLAERVDLLDAFDETAPRIEVAATPEQVTGEVVVMAAGATVSKQTRTRRELAAKNRPVFEAFAAALARNEAGQGGVVVVTNPVELGVEILSRHLDRHRVLGMGAQQDSLRFARAIANGAGVRRDRVHAWVLGEHGEAQVPLWSSVRLLGESSEEDRQRIEGLRAGRGPGDPASETEPHKRRVFELLADERIREAFDAVEELPPDLRVMLEPFVTAHCLHSTPNATANATLDVIRALCGARESVVGAQVRLEGEAYGLNTPIGVPVLVDTGGWSRVVCPPLSDEEAARLAAAAQTIEANLAQWTR